MIETTEVTSRTDVFPAVTALLAEHAVDIKAQAICREASSGKLMMLVPIYPEQTDAVKRKLLDLKLPPSATVIFYDCCPPGK
jgi:hypothetical protein